MEPQEIIVRVSADQRRVNEWALVLASAGIEHRLVRSDGRWMLIVAADEAATAEDVLLAFERENSDAAQAGRPLWEYGRSRAAVIAAILLVVFHYGILWSSDSAEWMRRGRASAFWILDGQVWRWVTALTLHVGSAHVVGNAATLALFGSALCRIFGPGLGLLLILTAGAGGNAINAVLRGPPHQAVGASTAVFGAVGALAAVEFVRRSYTLRRPRRAWIPVAAGLALLGMLGTGESSDILAHLFGLLVGGTLGAAAASLLPAPPGRGMQAALTTAVITVVVGCWILAWR
jgi:membrane associated rhomboid family serine protease